MYTERIMDYLRVKECSPRSASFLPLASASGSLPLEGILASPGFVTVCEMSAAQVVHLLATWVRSSAEPGLWGSSPAALEPTVKAMKIGY